ncbi:HXXEE domain-containing protein [Pannonibacter sp. Pt2-lr]
MRSIAPGWGLIAVYLLLINAALHVVQGLVLRLYNPGLVTAVALFIPLGVYAMVGLWP